MDASTILQNIKGGLIVSCQAAKDEPFFGHMDLFAASAKKGGAVGLRVDYRDIALVQGQGLPVIGIYKDMVDGQIIITPTIEHVKKIIDADIIAFDATKRRSDEEIQAFVSFIQKHGKVAMADISTFEEGMRAFKIGADIVASTLSGYTSWSPTLKSPDLQLVTKLSQEGVCVIAEGRISTPLQARAALDAGAHAVVVGSAITRPILITQQYVDALKMHVH